MQAANIQRMEALYLRLPAELFEIISAIAVLAALWSREYRKVAESYTVETSETLRDLIGVVLLMGGALYSIVHFPNAARFALQALMVFGIAEAFHLLLQPFVDLEHTRWKSVAVHAVGFGIGFSWMAAVHYDFHVLEVNQTIVAMLGVVVGGAVTTDSFKVLSAGLWLFF